MFLNKYINIKNKLLIVITYPIVVHIKQIHLSYGGLSKSDNIYYFVTNDSN